MTCQDMMDLMQRNLDLDLSAAEEQALLAHLQGCPDCTDLYERLKLLNGELAQLPKIKPPYSIVDSIMPQLEGLGGFSEPGAAADLPAAAAPVADELAARRGKQGLISWKIVAGVAAAGIMLGMFIFDDGAGRLNNKMAEEILEPKQMKDSTAASAEAEQSAAGAHPSPLAVYDQAGTPFASAPAAASGSTNSGTAKTPAPSAASQPETPPKDGRQVSSAASSDGSHKDQAGAVDQYGTGGGAAPKQQAAETKDTLTGAAGNAAPAESGALKSEPTPAAQKGGEAAVEASPEAGSSAGVKETETPSIMRAPETTPAPSGEAGVLGDINKGAVHGFTAPRVAGPAIQPMASADGAYTASLVELSVAITGKDGTEVFHSGVKLAAGDVLTFKGWSEGGFFTYSIQRPDGQETTYRISAADKKEIVL